jgi:hypothetical protein
MLSITFLGCHGFGVLDKVVSSTNDQHPCARPRKTSCPGAALPPSAYTIADVEIIVESLIRSLLIPHERISSS